jgi:hypothetical protein
VWHVDKVEQGGTVALVVDEAYGDRLHLLAARMPVWIISSPANSAAAKSWWSAHEEGPLATRVTLFTGGTGTTREEVAVATIGTIDMHHGPEAEEFPFTILSVCGVKPSPAIREMLRTYGLTELCDTPDGFVATKPPD